MQLANPLTGGGANGESLLEYQTRSIARWPLSVTEVTEEGQTYRRDHRWRPLSKEEIEFYWASTDNGRAWVFKGVVSLDQCYWVRSPAPGDSAAAAGSSRPRPTMKRLLLILLLLNGVLVLPAPLALLVASGVVPDLPSWPQDLIIRNNSGQRINVTPICVRPDGSPRLAKLYPDRKTQRMLDRVGGLPVEAGATATFVYDREYADVAALIIEDEQGQLRELAAPAAAAGQPLTIDIDSLETLAALSPKYARVFDEAQHPRRRLRWPLVWFLLPCLTFVLLFVAYRRAK